MRYGGAQEKAALYADLLGLARRQGLADSPQVLADIEAVADGQWRANEAADAVREQHERVRDSIERANEAAREFVGDLVRGLIEGRDAGELLHSVLGKVADRALDASLNAILPSGGGGLLGSLFSKLGLPKFAEGGRPPVGMPSIVGERGPELFVPDTSGRIIPNHQLGGAANTFQISVNLAGANGDAAIAAAAQRAAYAGAEMAIRRMAGPEGAGVLQSAQWRGG